MFKNIQNTLLLKHPLLWNTRLIPVLSVNLIVHLLFFISGYYDGIIHFEEATEYSDSFSDTMATINVLLSLLVIITWLVFYLRNNAFKAFYPRKKGFLYNEWLILLVIFATTFSYHFTFSYGKDFHRRSYFTIDELTKRTDNLSMVSAFVNERNSSKPISIDTVVKGVTQGVYRDYVLFKKKKYPLNSLFNQSLSTYPIQSDTKDSLNRLRLCTWLQNNQKDSVRWLFDEAVKLCKEHKLSYKGDTEQWLGRVYFPPKFVKYRYIGDSEYTMIEGNNYSDDDYLGDDIYIEPTTYEDKQSIPKSNDTLYVYYNNPAYDTINLIDNDVKKIRSYVYAYPKFYIPMKQLEQSYRTISFAWSNPIADYTYAFCLFLLSLGSSLLLFAFRVTSVKSVIIAAVASGLLALVIGIISLLLYFIFPQNHLVKNSFAFISIIIYVALLVYLYNTKTTKKYSAPALIIALAYTVVFVPILQYIFIEWYRLNHLAKEDDYDVVQNLYNLNFTITNIWLLAFVLLMYYITEKIRKWRGIAEA